MSLFAIWEILFWKHFLCTLRSNRWYVTSYPLRWCHYLTPFQFPALLNPRPSVKTRYISGMFLFSPWMTVGTIEDKRFLFCPHRKRIRDKRPWTFHSNVSHFKTQINPNIENKKEKAQNLQTYTMSLLCAFMEYLPWGISQWSFSRVVFENFIIETMHHGVVLKPRLGYAELYYHTDGDTNIKLSWLYSSCKCFHLEYWYLEVWDVLLLGVKKQIKLHVVETHVESGTLITLNLSLSSNGLK